MTNKTADDHIADVGKMIDKQTSRESEMTLLLNQFRLLMQAIADCCDLDPEECAINVKTVGTDEKLLHRITMADLFTRTDNLLGKPAL